jgi:hypothetical protein
MAMFKFASYVSGIWYVYEGKNISTVSAPAAKPNKEITSFLSRRQ